MVQEILSRKLPFPEYRFDVQVALAISKGKLPGRVDLSKDPVLGLYEADLWTICNKCWEAASTRPQIAEVEASIGKILGRMSS